MTPSRRESDPGPGPESIGALLMRVRLATGRSQLRVAELLCAASGAPTLTRHEVSRWEREERIPGQRWLPWLAMVLDVALDDLERAAAVARARRGDPVSHPTRATGRESTADLRLLRSFGWRLHAWTPGASKVPAPARGRRC
jgi:transcriptional regulator with XRE-family HTH domain